MLVPLVLLPFVYYCSAQNPKVETPLGPIEGYFKTSYNGWKYSAFEGIPYAKPPIGHRRFEEPEPIEPWSGTLNATHLTQCAQIILEQNITLGDEDCLTINVYVPREVPNLVENLNVIVHIHGGGFMYGSGQLYTNPQFLMDKDVIFVTFNYRVGVFGFLSTEDEVIPGNNGMKDQVLALKWVQKNIRSFGGNPNSVTITGLSAGASSVHLHYLSPLSKGLFTRGFSESGTATNIWTIQTDPLSKAQRLGESLGCSTKSSRNLLECLKEKLYVDILNKVLIFSGFQYKSMLPFTPVVEKENPKSFLSDLPENFIKQGKVADVPWLVSNTANEGTSPGNSLVAYLDEINQKWDSVAPLLLQFNSTVPEPLQANVSDQIKNFYFGPNQNISQETLVPFIKIFTDRFFLIDSEKGVKLQAAVTNSSIYYYFFTYPGDFNDAQIVSHGDDVKYYFGSILNPRPLTENELKMKDIMVDMLVSYAKTGTPVIKGVDWKATGADKLTYIQIANFEIGDIETKSTEDLSGVKDFWNSLVHFSTAETPHIKTSLGTITGYIKTSYGGRKYSAFEGIPYAKPPLGQRRFEEPEPIEPWHGTWVATHLTECAQVNTTHFNIQTGSEDCLHINVYVPRETPNPQEALDVVVHIHAGAYMIGSGHMYANPQFLMDKDIVFVTFNYRLGVLGFLSTEDEVVPGNNGMKDQVLALKWVQENIASFGGNPKSVTLTGLSAGGSSTHLHYFSPLSKSLFHRGFSQSGTATNFWTIQEEALDKAKRLGESLGCPTNTTRILVDCLKEKPLRVLLEEMKLFSGYEKLPIMPFTPVVEKTGLNPFLTDHPYNLLKKGEVLDIPWVSSNVLHEGTFPEHFFATDLDNIDRNWDSLAPVLFDYNYTLPKSVHTSVSQKIKGFYLGENQKISQETSLHFIKIFTDRYFLVDTESAAKLQAEVNKSPVYYYFFTYPGDIEGSKIVGHAFDAKYFFGHVFSPQLLTENELKMKDVLLEMLVYFARTGVPVIKGVDWKPTKGDKLTYLQMGGFATKEMVLKTTDDLTGAKKLWKSVGLFENDIAGICKDEL